MVAIISTQLFGDHQYLTSFALDIDIVAYWFVSLYIFSSMY
jgi:hypothetical protein